MGFVVRALGRTGSVDNILRGFVRIQTKLVRLGDALYEEAARQEEIARKKLAQASLERQEAERAYSVVQKLENLLR